MKTSVKKLMELNTNHLYERLELLRNTVHCPENRPFEVSLFNRSTSPLTPLRQTQDRTQGERFMSLRRNNSIVLGIKQPTFIRIRSTWFNRVLASELCENITKFLLHLAAMCIIVTKTATF
jgi:hypothetical protein